MYKITIRTIFIGVFLAHCTFAVGQYSDTTYQISGNKSIAIPSKDRTVAIKGVTIQNSLPKGGSYVDPAGKNFGYRIFWTRVYNETDTPLELTIKFPADSYAIFPSSDAYLKLFLPSDTMSLSKQWDYDHGATGLKSYFDTEFNKPSTLQKTLNPEEEYFFYVAAIFFPRSGFVRSGFVLKDQNLFYRISMVPELDAVLIPCGQIVLER